MRAEASSSSSPATYHVFLTFNMEDSVKAFIDHLHEALKEAGYRTCLDEDGDEGTERGENIISELEKSRISIIVFSERYAYSTRCLDKLVMILQNKRTSSDSHRVLPVFYNVFPHDVRQQDGNFGEAFKRYEERLKAEEGESKDRWTSKLEEWKNALKEAAGLAGMDLDCYR
ncbi:hypothetical protein NMG60_11032479 [Bertholletia excelsa]